MRPSFVALTLLGLADALVLVGHTRYGTAPVLRALGFVDPGAWLSLAAIHVAVLFAAWRARAWSWRDLLAAPAEGSTPLFAVGSPAERRASGVLALLLLAFSAVHLRVVVAYALDVPICDEADAFLLPLPSGEALDDPLSWSWLSAFRGQHRVVFTALQSWVLYRLDGWDLVRHQVANFFVFGLTLLAFFALCRRLAPELPRWWLLAFFAFLLSPLGFSNHSWGYQSQFTFAILGYLGAVAGWFHPEQRPGVLAAGVLCACFAAFAMSSGVVLLAGVAPVFLLFKLERLRAPGADRRRELVQALAVLGALGLCVVLWAQGARAPVTREPLVYPWEAGFWPFVLDLSSLGLGFDHPAPAVGALSCLLILAPLPWIRRDAHGYALLALVAGVFAFVGAVGMSRSGSLEYGAKAGRYFTLTSLFVPLLALGWARLFTTRGLPRLRGASGLLLFVFCCVGFGDDWRFDPYRKLHAQRSGDLAIVAEYYATDGAKSWPGAEEGTRLPHLHLRIAHLEEARRLRLAFWRRLVEPR